MLLSPSVNGRDAAAIIEALEAGAAACARRLEPGTTRQSIEPLVGLHDGAVGWHTTRQYEGWGEIAAIPLDVDRVLVVGVESSSDDAPIDVRDLLALALEGAEQFPMIDE
jgi:hypothetical protein